MSSIEQVFFERLRLSPIAAELSSATELSVRTQLALRRKACLSLVRDELDEANVQFTLLAVALFDVVEPLLGRVLAARLVDDCLNQPLRECIVEGTRQMLDQAEDPFRALVDASKKREQHDFGPSFSFDRLVDQQDGYVLQIRRCLFHEVLRACGRTELQPILCRFDFNWMDAVDPERHHVQVIRPSTFATSDRCQMWFARTDGDVASRLPVI